MKHHVALYRHGVFCIRGFAKTWRAPTFVLVQYKNFFILFLAACCLIGCKNGNYRPMVEYSGYAQGTTYHIICDESGSDLDQELDTLFKKLDHSISVWDSLSIVSQFNRSTNGIWADAYFIDVLNLSKRIHTETDGAFNPAIYPILQAQKNTQKPLSTDSLLNYSRLEDIGIGSSSDSSKKGVQFVYKKHSKSGLDFQGVAQGYSVDVVCKFLDSKNISNYRVEVGNQIRAKGNDHYKQPWQIGLDKPTSEGQDRVIQSIIPIGSLSISISGDYRNFYEKNGRQYNTYIDPHTGKMTENALLNAYVFAPSAAEADAYATAFMVMGAGKTTQFLARKKNITAYLISSGFDADFQTWMSPELEKTIAESK